MRPKNCEYHGHARRIRAKKGEVCGVGFTFLVVVASAFPVLRLSLLDDPRRLWLLG